MGIYRRPSGIYWLTLTVNGKTYWESCGTHNRKLAAKILAIRQAEIAEGRWNLPSSNPPSLKTWATQFLRSIENDNTRKRYGLSVAHLLIFFGENSRLSNVTSARRIEEFKRERLDTGVKAATVNRDLSVLRRMLTLACRQRLISRNPFEQVELLEERIMRKQPRIISYDEQNRIVAVAAPHLRALIILLTETGLRVAKEALRLKWSDFDFAKSQVTIKESKTIAGRRIVPLSELCKEEMTRWRNFAGDEYSEFVFPNFLNPSRPLLSVRKTWSTALKNAKIQFFPVYYLRHTFASRLNAAGASALTISQMLGHSGSSGIVQTYAKVLDDTRRDAIRKLSQYRETQSAQAQTEPLDNPTIQ